VGVFSEHSVKHASDVLSVPSVYGAGRRSSERYGQHIYNLYHVLGHA